MLSRWLQQGLLLLGAVSTVAANKVAISDKESLRQTCAGMYSKQHWGGDVDPFIEVSFDRAQGATSDPPIVSLIIWEYEDSKYIGHRPAAGDRDPDWICGEKEVTADWCNSTQVGQYIVNPEARTAAKNQLLTKAVNLLNDTTAHYPIKSTGYYCISTQVYRGTVYSGTVQFRNAYGALPAAQIAKLPFYGALAIVYIVIGAFWAFLYVQHRHDILPVQNYITAIIIFLIFEMILTTGYYDFQNQHGNGVGTKIFMIIISILSAARNSFSFFLLLIVCMGYGVVKMSLGKTMLYVRGLAGAHFFFGMIYAIASLTITPESAGPVVLLVILPLAATLTAFYVWTLNSLNMTLKDLLDRKQNAKALMYKKLWWGILVSIFVIFGFFFINSFTFAGAGDPDFVPRHWRTRWFILDGWLNLVYLCDIAFISYLWRPTANNRRFAMSDELAQDDDGFEIASYGGSVDEEDVRTPAGDSTPSQPGVPKFGGAREGEAYRKSLDGEPLFAVDDDDDRWSDDGSTRHSEERRRLTKEK